MRAEAGRAIVACAPLLLREVVGVVRFLGERVRFCYMRLRWSCCLTVKTCWTAAQASRRSGQRIKGRPSSRSEEKSDVMRIGGREEGEMLPRYNLRGGSRPKSEMQPRLAKGSNGRLKWEVCDVCPLLTSKPAADRQLL